MSHHISTTVLRRSHLKTPFKSRHRISINNGRRIPHHQTPPAHRNSSVVTKR
ncbi:hypothetical protein Hanom_Chr09g00790561 [Helianthus anomalus]